MGSNFGQMLVCHAKGRSLLLSQRWIQHNGKVRWHIEIPFKNWLSLFCGESRILVFIAKLACDTGAEPGLQSRSPGTKHRSRKNIHSPKC